MSHNLSTFTDERGNTKHCMLSLRESPWHQLGQRIEQPVGSSEAIKLAGLDWSVSMQGIYTTDMLAVPEHRAVVRSDTNAVLGIVKDSYQPVQNRELFAWFDSLSGTAPIVYETAGALGKGETVWILAKMPDEIRVGHDLTQCFMLLYSGHAANRLLTIAPTGVRVVCANTLRLAVADIRANRRKRRLEAGYRIRHTAGVRRALDDVAAAYAKTKASIDATRDAYNFLARVPMTEAMVATVLEQAFKRDQLAPSEADRAAAMRKARDERVRAILASPTCTGVGVNGTAFALLNAVTEYVDHVRGTRTREGQSTGTQRFASAHFGSGALVKEAAWDAVLEASNA
jgi:phage/plasmid-like protein (TIGR03299 family)